MQWHPLWWSGGQSDTTDNLCGGLVVSGIADFCKYTVSAVWVNMVVVSMKGS